jgi:hypothetical protein
MICSFHLVSWVKTAPIASFSAATYNRKGTPLFGALITGGVDKYSLISSNAACFSTPQINSASFLTEE